MWEGCAYPLLSEEWEDLGGEGGSATGAGPQLQLRTVTHTILQHDR